MFKHAVVRTQAGGEGVSQDEKRYVPLDAHAAETQLLNGRIPLHHTQYLIGCVRVLQQPITIKGLSTNENQPVRINQNDVPISKRFAKQAKPLFTAGDFLSEKKYRLNQSEGRV